MGFLTNLQSSLTYGCVIMPSFQGAQCDELHVEHKPTLYPVSCVPFVSKQKARLEEKKRRLESVRERQLLRRCLFIARGVQ